MQEEKRAHAEREQKQAQKIENLSTLVLNSTVDDRDFEKRTKKVLLEYFLDMSGSCKLI